MAHRLGIKDRVVFCGYRNDIPEIMTEIDVLVLGSDYKGFGLVLLGQCPGTRFLLHV